MSAEPQLACKPGDYKSDVKPVWCPGCGDFCAESGPIVWEMLYGGPVKALLIEPFV